METKTTMGSTQKNYLLSEMVLFWSAFFYGKGAVALEDKQVARNLLDFSKAVLIGEGDFDFNNSNDVLSIPFNKQKSLYLSEVLKNEQISNYIEINSKKEQLSIHSHPILKTLKDQWYKDNSKIFSLTLDPGLITLKSIIVCINLFGIRKLESISLPTSIDRDHLKTLSYCLEKHLKVPVTPSNNQMKITDIPKLVTSAVSDISALHSAELINYLTTKEKKLLTEGILR